VTGQHQRSADRPQRSPEKIACTAGGAAGPCASRNAASAAAARGQDDRAWLARFAICAPSKGGRPVNCFGSAWYDWTSDNTAARTAFTAAPRWYVLSCCAIHAANRSKSRSAAAASSVSRVAVPSCRFTTLSRNISRDQDRVAARGAAERAALALAEAVTRLSDRPDPVPDDIWDEAARHYDERGLAALVLWISVVNVFNRVNVATRQVPGEWLPQPDGS
jgi:alkylhydroperoxidase family enzyme